MRADKEPEGIYEAYKISKDWAWTNPTYTLQLLIDAKDVVKIEIDPSGRMLDVNREDNIMEFSNEN